MHIAHIQEGHEHLGFYKYNLRQGLSEGTVYFARGVTTDTFQVAATAGGAPIQCSARGDMECKVSKIVPETFGSQGTLQVTSITLNLNA